MKCKLIVATTLFLGLSANAEKKVDWKPCEADIAKLCATAKDDHEKHECLEKAGNKVSKACAAHNAKNEPHSEDSHKGHSH